MAISKESIHKHTLTTAKEIRAALKSRGIHVEDVEGGHESDHALRGLQELQAVSRALKEADVAASESAPAAASTSGVRTDGPVDGATLRSSASIGETGSQGKK